MALKTDTKDEPAGRILIVDDEVGVVSALTRLLTREGFETRGCSTSSEALSALRQIGYDVLLSDLMMPDMDGIMLLRSALAIDPNLIGIVMTGHGDIHTAVEAMKSGAFDYITKPLQMSFLLPVLSRAIAVRRLRTENVQLREAVAVYELSTAVASSLDVGTILSRTAEAALQTCRADEVSIVLPQEGKDEGYIAVVRGGNREHLVGQAVPFAQSIVGWVAHSHEPLLLNGMVKDPRFIPARPRQDIRSAIAFPLIAGQQVVGVLNLNATLRPRSFTQSDFKTLSALAGIAAPALINTQLHAQLKRESSIKSDFLAVMSHEFRTPLHIIQGYLDLLEDGTFGPLTLEQRFPLQKIRKSAASLLELILSTFDVRKLLQGEVPLTITEIEVPVLIAEFQGEIENLRLEKPELRIEWQVAPEIPVFYSDRAKLKLVLRNLFHNAIKFTEAGSVTAGVTAHNHGVEFRVSDTGIGMTPEQLPIIFEMFQQGDGSETRGYGGLGLGLYIVRQMLDLLGGTVTVDSEVGRGSTFRVWVPQTHARDSAITPALRAGTSDA
jgi:signal transduction histidine kinase/FixJ family two-component response regulator